MTFLSPPANRQFSLLGVVAIDPVANEIFSDRATVQGWLAFEKALARAQAVSGVIDTAVIEALDRVTVDDIDLPRLWEDTHTVGYPILPLLRQIDTVVATEARGRIHLGATTQDVMDSALALQMKAVLARLADLIGTIGDQLCDLVELHSGSPMAARTHGQQAVPTTLGAVLATFVAEFGRHLERINSATPRVARLSLFGAGGTSAGYGLLSPVIREAMAREMGLTLDPVSWHSARDGVAEFGFLCAAVAATLGRLGREVVDLSRTEVGELNEPAGHHRGASSTMPQKVNPVTSEAAIGAAIAAASNMSGLLHAMIVPQERSAGEWQSEWELVPRISVLACSSAREIANIIPGLIVHSDRMERNLTLDSGLIMAEAYMMALSSQLGREVAHDVVYAAASVARAEGAHIHAVLTRDPITLGIIGPEPLSTGSYLGEAHAVCAPVVAAWRLSRSERSANVQEADTDPDFG